MRASDCRNLNVSSHTKVWVWLHRVHSIQGQGCRPQVSCDAEVLEIDSLKQGHILGALRVGLFIYMRRPHIHQYLNQGGVMMLSTFVTVACN